MKNNESAAGVDGLPAEVFENDGETMMMWNCGCIDCLTLHGNRKISEKTWENR